MKKAAIVGATGFGGLGLIDLLTGHPGISIQSLSALDHGKKISDMYPHLKGICELPVMHPDESSLEDIDIAFFATPDQVGMNIIKKYYEKNIPVIDFSGDFRFSSIEDYSVYASNKNMSTVHKTDDLLKKSVYGLPEKYRDQIKTAPIIGNPGCFSIAMILALLPLSEAGEISSETIICDGKTGVSGAGINPGKANSYPLRYEAANSYKEGQHQHLVEVENLINISGVKNHSVFFVPQIIPMNRGIIVTSYLDTKSDLSEKDLNDLYADYYRESPFVLVSNISPSTAEVRGTNRCVIKPVRDKRTGKVLIISVIDNLMKGQSGNAVQNANIRLGFEETAGLDITPFYP